MRKGDIDRFFREVAKSISFPVKIYLTGGVASWLMGGNRPTDDIDFGVKAGRQEQSMVKVLNETSQKLKISIQFSENISRWGMIEIPNYEKEANLYNKFRSVSVYLLDVASWSIGKLSRYYQSDLDDLIVVLKKQKPKPEKMIKCWANALKKSPYSSNQITFVKTVENFLTEQGPKIWGSKFDSQKGINQFNRLSKTPTASR